MVTQLGTFLGTELGTDLGTFTDFPAVAAKLYGLAVDTSNYYATQAGGGESGDVGGFGILMLARLEALTGVQGMLFGRGNGASDGYQAYLLSSHTTNFRAYVPGLTQHNGRVFTASDVGKIFALYFQHTGTTLTSGLGGEPQRTPTAVAGFISSSAAMLACRHAGFTPVGGWLSFRGVPSDAQLQDAMSAARSLGDVPATITGATVPHRWSLKEALAGTAVVDGQAAPATLPDIVTAASIDEMARQGSPTVRVIDTSIDGRKTYGALGFSTTSQLVSSGAPLNGATVSLELEMVFNTALASGKHIISNATGSSVVGGFSVYQSANTINIFSYGPGVNAGYSVPASYAGQFVTLKVELTGAVIRAYLNNVSLGADVAATYTASSRPLYVGTFGDGTSPADNVSIYRVKGGTIAQPVLHDWDLTTAVTANGGPDNGIPATVQDRIGTDHLTKVGTGIQVAQRTERVWSYETSPTIRGAEAMTLADYFEAAINTLAGDPAGFTVSILLTVNTQAIASATRRLYGQRAGLNPGWAVESGASNQAIIFKAGNASGVATAPAVSVGSGDVGKAGLYTFVWDAAAGVVRSYAKRLQVGTGVALAGGFTADPVVPMIGRTAGVHASAEALTIHGVYYAPGIATLAQYQAQCDAAQATERMQPCPGLPGVLIDLTTDIIANGGALPATLTDRGLGSVNFTKIGNPSPASSYAHAWTW